MPIVALKLLRELCAPPREHWLTDEQFEWAIAGTNVPPGPASTQLAIYISRNRPHERFTYMTTTLGSQHTAPQPHGATVYHSIDSPLGELLLTGDGSALHGLYMREGRHALDVTDGLARSATPFAAAREQLGEYFAGERTDFELPLQLRGTPFQRKVWAALSEIPYGETVSYGELAARIGNASAVRAVGLANGRNPISVIVPCHRVIGAGGELTGYGGGLERKRILLELERGQSRLGL